MVREHRLVHCHNGVQHGERAVVDGSDKLGAYVDLLLLLTFREKCQDNLADFFSRLKSNGMDGGNSCPMGAIVRASSLS